MLERGKLSIKERLGGHFRRFLIKIERLVVKS
jgi:hypothetical protein